MEQNTSDKNPIDDFKSWALKLGCPVNALPSDAVLNRFIKSNRTNAQKLTDLVRPKSEVKSIKDNLLLRSVTKLNLLLERHQSNLPDSIKNIKKVETLHHQISQLKPRVQLLKSGIKDKQMSLAKKGMFCLMFYVCCIIRNFEGWSKFPANSPNLVIHLHGKLTHT